MDFVFDAVADDKVINTPARVVDFAGFDSLSLPGINVFYITVNKTEAICKTFCQEICKAFALFVCKAGRKMVAGRICKVNFLVGNVEVPAGNNGLDGKHDGCLFTCKVDAKGVKTDFAKL